MLNAADGNLDPSGTTHAYAKAAKIGGAEIYRRSARDRYPSAHGRFVGCRDDDGAIRTEHVVNAGGLWAREVGRMVGIELPVLAMEHMYLVTDEIPEVMAYNEFGRELPHAIDFKAEI
jgi:dimethylglycine dehydrogenase